MGVKIPPFFKGFMSLILSRRRANQTESKKPEPMGMEQDSIIKKKRGRKKSGSQS